MTVAVVTFAPDHSDVKVWHEKADLSEIPPLPERHLAYKVIEVEPGNFAIVRLAGPDRDREQEATMDDLVQLHNATTTGDTVKKFESKAAGVKRIVRGVVSDQTKREENGEVSAVQASEETKVKKPRGTKMATGKEPVAAEDLKKVHTGTVRAHVLALMDGTRTAQEIADQLKLADVAKVMAHAYCTHRDVGVGYAVTDGKLKALYPSGKSIDDVVVDELPKKA